MEGKGFSFILIIILVFLSITLAGLAGYVFIVGPSGQKTNTTTTVQQETTKTYTMEELDNFPLIEKKNFNLKKLSPNEIAVVMATVEIQYIKQPTKKATAEETKHKIEFYKAELIAAIGDYFQEKTTADLSAHGAKEKAGEEITKKANEIINSSLKEDEKVKIVNKVIFDWFYQ